MEIDEGKHKRRAKREDDVFVLVKEYISSTEMRQKPLLCLRGEDAAGFPLLTERCLSLFT